MKTTRGQLKTTRLDLPFWWYLFGGGAARYHHFGGTFSRPFKSAFLKSLKRVPFDTGLEARIPTVAAERKHGIRHGSLWEPPSVSKIGPGTAASAAASFRCSRGKPGPGRKSSTGYPVLDFWNRRREPRRLSGACLLDPPPGASKPVRTRPLKRRIPAVSRPPAAGPKVKHRISGA